MTETKMNVTITLPVNSNKDTLNKMIINEKVDVEMVNKILNSKVLHNLKWKEDEVKLMENTLKKLNKEVCKKGYNKLLFEERPFGRVYVKNNKVSLGTLYRRVRHTLCRKLYVDVDIVNCQPTILNDVLRDNNLKHDKLDFYINNREIVLEDIIKCFDCKREHAKELINSLVNGGSIKTWMDKNNLQEKVYCTFIHKLSEELFQSRKTIINNNSIAIQQLKDYYNKKNKNYNGDHVFISYFLGQYEKIIIEFVICCLKERSRINNDNVFIYCQDGIMILKEAYVEQDFRDIENYLREKASLNIKFKVKEMDEGFSEEELKSVQLKDDELFEQYKEEFETEFFKLNNPVCYVRELPDNKLQYFKPCELREYLLSSKYRFNDEKRTFYNSWTTSTNIRVKESIIFDPSNLNDDTYYNLFRGFPYDDPNVDDLDEKSSKVLELIHHLCHKDTSYILDWISRIVQNPSRKTEWAIILYSKVGGVGKNCLTDFMVKMIGEYAGMVTNIEDITKKFNVDLCNKLFIYGDEINAGAKKVADELKKVITGKEKTMEKKNYDATKIKDFSNYLFTTNNEHCFKIEAEDRRYLLIRCTDQRKSDDFYSEFYQELDDELMMKQLFKYFKNRKIEYTLNKAPMTDYKQELIIEQYPAYIQMLYRKPAWFAEKKLTSSRLFDCSQDYAKKKFLTSNYTMTRCGLDLGEILSEYKTKSSCIYFKFPDVHEFKRYLYKKNPSYYKYINGFSENEDVDFDKEDEDDNEIFSMY